MYYGIDSTDSAKLLVKLRFDNKFFEVAIRIIFRNFVFLTFSYIQIVWSWQT